jgi:hypothetical protein
MHESLLRPVHHRWKPRYYRVKEGDTLSSIAQALDGSAKDWSDVWWVNRRAISNPDVIRAGMVIRISAWHPDPPAWVTRKATAAIPRAASAQQGSVRTDASTTAPDPASQPVNVGTDGAAPGSFQACVISRESGGNPQIMNASGHWGLYQFSYGTWVAAGGAPSAFGNAGADVQTQVFERAYALWGASPWAASDGC